MSSDISSSAPEKKALTPAVVWTRALDDALDRAETQWITPQQFAQDDRFAAIVNGELRRRDRSGLQNAARANLFGLKQSRRVVHIRVPGRGGHLRSTTAYAYALWRIYKWLGIEDDRRPKPPPATPRGPLRQSVRFTSPTPQDEETHPAPPVHRPHPAPPVTFIPPPAQPELAICGPSGW